MSHLNVNGCTGTATVLQSVSPCTDIKLQTNSGLNVEMYQNPTTGLYTISVSSTAQIIVLNSIGQIISNEMMTEGKREFNISQFANGIYFVKSYCKRKSTNV